MDVHASQFFRRQYGLITRAQALGPAAMTRHQVANRLETGAWHVSDYAVYRNSAVPVTWEQRVLAACLGTGGIASHRSAAVLWELDRVRRGRPEIVVPRGRHVVRDELRLHETTQWQLRDECARRGIPCTGLGRTLIDLAAVVPYAVFEDAVDSALRRRSIDWVDLAEIYVLHARRGRDGCGSLRLLLEYRYGDKHIPLSQWSRGVQRLLLDAGLPLARLEHAVYDGDEFVGQVDLAFPASKVAIELQSLTWHFNVDSFHKDPQRRNRLHALGWTVYEFTWRDYVDCPDELCETVRSAICPG